jgi:hypothetical protein
VICARPPVREAEHGATSHGSDLWRKLSVCVTHAVSERRAGRDDHPGRQTLLTVCRIGWAVARLGSGKVCVTPIREGQ